MRHLLLALLLALAPSSAYAAKLKVVATFSILGDIASRVGGDNIEVTTLVGPDADAHTYEPTPDAVKSIGSADLVIVNGLNFEGWMGRLIVSSGYAGPVVVAARNITPLNSGDKLEIDPHAWQDVANVISYVATIRDALIEADRAHSAKYKENANTYTRELEALETWVKAKIALVPADQRSVITTHDAFQYFGRYYGVQFLAPSGTGNDAAPSAATVARIIDQMRHEHVHALFLENVSDPKTINQLQQEAGAYIGGTLYSDALSSATGPATTYIAMVKHNVNQLVAGMLHNGQSPAQATAETPDSETIEVTIP